MSDGVESSKMEMEAGGRYLCFSLGKEKFAIPLLQVKEVIANTETTNIPQAPAYFRGIMNLRGQIISVVDLRTKLKIGKAEASSETTIIILDFMETAVGVVVDSVDCVVAYGPADISAPPDQAGLIKNEHLLGVAREKNSLVLIADIKAILGKDEFLKTKPQASKVA